MFGFIKELGKIDVDYNDNKFRSYVKSVESDYILIDFLFYKESEYNIPVENWVTVKFKEKAGVYSGDCQILGRDNSRIPGLKISYPSDVKFVQQREYVRVPLKLKAELVIFSVRSGSEKPEEGLCPSGRLELIPESEETDVRVQEINTLDISGSGFCYVSEKPLEKHSKIIGIIYLSNPAEKPIEISLQHVYSRTFFANGKEMYKNAFTFNNLEEKLQDKILKEIFLYELELRKKGL